MQKTPAEQKQIRQEIQNRKHQPTKKYLSLDEPRTTIEHSHDLVQVKSPIIESELLPKPASRSPSQILPYVQSKCLVSQLDQ